MDGCKFSRGGGITFISPTSDSMVPNLHESPTAVASFVKHISHALSRAKFLKAQQDYNVNYRLCYLSLLHLKFSFVTWTMGEI